MKFLFALFFLVVFFVCGSVNTFASEDLIEVVTFDSSRSPQWLLDVHNAPLYTNAGSSNIVEALKDETKFGGEDAFVDCGVKFLPTVEVVLPGSLVDESGMLLADVFFGPILNWAVSPEEAEELASFIDAGGVVFVADSTIIGGPKYNLLLESLSISDRWLETNVYNPPTYFSTPHYVITETVLGPFGDVNILEHRDYRWLEKYDLVGIFKDVPDFSLPYIVAEKGFGKGYLVVSSGQIYSNVFTGGDNDNLEYFLNMFAMGCKEDSASEAVILDVPSLKQYDEPWGGNEYDSAIVNNLGCGTSIGDCGCAMTSATMVMKYFGVDLVQGDTQIDPGSVNRYFTDNGLYYLGQFSWFKVDDYTNLFDAVNGVKLDQPVREDYNLLRIKEYIDDGTPVIVKVMSPYGEHWVVVKGYDDEGLIINDPARFDEGDYAYLDQSGYVPVLQSGMIHYIEAHTDYSSFEVLSEDDVLVTQNGSKVGRYYTDGEGNYLSRRVNTVELQLPEEGVYLIEVIPGGDGVCEERIYGSTKDGSVTLKDFYNCSERVSFDGEGSVAFEVGVDIRPANENNFVNGISNSVFPVVILGSSDLDVEEIDFTTVSLEGAEPFWAGRRRWLRDVDRDGYNDAILFFEREKMDYDFSGEACLDGRLESGFGFWGCDELRLVSGNI